MRTAVAGVLMVTALAGCETKKQKAEKASKAAVDSMAALRKLGKTDLSNPEMGSKVLVTVSEGKVELSHQEIPKGQITFAVVNKGTKAHIAEIKGPAGDWKTMPIRPGETVLMAMLVDPGEYDVFTADSASAAKDKSAFAHIKVTGDPTGVVPPGQKAAGTPVGKQK